MDLIEKKEFKHYELMVYRIDNTYILNLIYIYEINKEIFIVDLKGDLFEILSSVSDNMIIFNAGFILGSRANNLKIVLAGGTQMASVLLVVNS